MTDAAAVLDKDDETEAPARAPLCKMTERALKEAVVLRNHWCVTPPAGTTVEAMENPASWVHLARFLRPRDRIEVMPEDGEWMAEFVVMHKTNIGATVHRLHFWNLAEVEVEDAGAYHVKWRGPAAKFSVVRNTDGEILKDKFDDRSAAEKWALDNLA